MFAYRTGCASPLSCVVCVIDLQMHAQGFAALPPPLRPRSTSPLATFTAHDFTVYTSPTIGSAALSDGIISGGDPNSGVEMKQSTVDGQYKKLDAARK